MARVHHLPLYERVRSLHGGTGPYAPAPAEICRSRADTARPFQDRPAVEGVRAGPEPHKAGPLASTPCELFRSQVVLSPFAHPPPSKYIVSDVRLPQQQPSFRANELTNSTLFVKEPLFNHGHWLQPIIPDSVETAGRLHTESSKLPLGG